MFGIILLSVSLSIDALAVAFAQGIKGSRIPVGSKMLICLCSVIYFALSVWCGGFISELVDQRTSEILGIILFSMIFIIVVVQVIRSKLTGNVAPDFEIPEESGAVSNGNPAAPVADKSAASNRLGNDKPVGLSEAFILGSALSIDSIGIGIAFSMSTPVDIWGILLVGVMQIIFLSAGNFLGLKLGEKSGKHKDKLPFLSCAVIFVLFVSRLIKMT